MKRITTILAWLMAAPMAMGQALSYTPPPIGVYASADGLTWNAPEPQRSVKQCTYGAMIST